jgi:O-antigen/teichoic acid export membrane protein
VAECSDPLHRWATRASEYIGPDIVREFSPHAGSRRGRGLLSTAGGSGMIGAVVTGTSRSSEARGRHRQARWNPLPQGTAPIAAGLVVSGLSAYGFLAITARALGPRAYAPVAVLWTLVFIAVPGLFLPLEQEVSRAVSARRVAGIGARSVVRRAGAAGAVVAALVSISTAAAGSPLVSRLFDGQGSLLVGFVVSVLAYVAYYLTRGVLAGSGAFVAYGALLTAEGLVRVVTVAALAIAGVHAVGPYGLLVGLPVLAGVVAALLLHGGDLPPGPTARWAEISHAVGFLVAGSLLGQILVNAGPLAVKLLAGPGEQALTGTFLNGVVIARIPLFFFQAVQASLLPALAAQAAAGQFDEFRNSTVRLLAAVAAVALLAVAGSALLGPFVVSHFFGAGFRLGHLDMGLLAAASGMYMVALGMVQGVIALAGYRLVPVGWFLGVLAFCAVAAALGSASGMGVALRVELALLAGSLVSLVAVAVMLETRLRRAEHATCGSRGGG